MRKISLKNIWYKKIPERKPVPAGWILDVTVLPGVHMWVLQHLVVCLQNRAGLWWEGTGEIQDVHWLSSVASGKHKLMRNLPGGRGHAVTKGHFCYNSSDLITCIIYKGRIVSDYEFREQWRVGGKITVM